MSIFGLGPLQLALLQQAARQQQQPPEPPMLGGGMPQPQEPPAMMPPMMGPDIGAQIASGAMPPPVLPPSGPEIGVARGRIGPGQPTGPEVTMEYEKDPEAAAGFKRRREQALRDQRAGKTAEVAQHKEEIKQRKQVRQQQKDLRVMANRVARMERISPKAAGLMVNDWMTRLEQEFGIKARTAAEHATLLRELMKAYQDRLSNREKHGQAMELEGVKHTGTMELEGVKHTGAMELEDKGILGRKDVKRTPGGMSALETEKLEADRDYQKARAKHTAGLADERTSRADADRASREKIESQKNSGKLETEAYRYGEKLVRQAVSKPKDLALGATHEIKGPQELYAQIVQDPKIARAVETIPGFKKRLRARIHEMVANARERS